MSKCKPMFVIASVVALLAAPLGGYADTYRITATWETIRIPGSSSSMYWADHSMKMFSRGADYVGDATRESLMHHAAVSAQIATQGMQTSIPVEIEMTLAEDGSLQAYRIEYPATVLRTGHPDFSPQNPIMDYTGFVIIEWTPETRTVTHRSLDGEEEESETIASSEEGMQAQRAKEIDRPPITQLTTLDQYPRMLEVYRQFLSRGYEPVSMDDGWHRYEIDGRTYLLSSNKKTWKSISNVQGYSSEIEVMEVEGESDILLPKVVESRTPDDLCRITAQEVKKLTND